jgi:hypothetical protein
MTAPDLDRWLSEPAIRVSHRRRSGAPPDYLWDAALAVTLQQTSLLGRLVRWRIPGTPAEISFDELFRNPPFLVLDEAEHMLVSGLVGRIWTLRRDYPELATPEAYRSFSERGTARVLFANWIDAGADGESATLSSEVRVEAIGAQGRIGVAAVRPLVRAFEHLIGTDGIEAAVRRAERRTPARAPARAPAVQR